MFTSEELLDIYNENNEPLGFTEPRFIVHRDGLWHRTVHVYVLNKSDQYLVHLRSPYKDLRPNHWDVCLGGHVSAGKDYEETAIEELKQEIDLDVDPNDLILCGISKNDKKINKEYSQIYFYKLENDSIDFRFRDNEIVEAKWMSVKDVISAISKNPEKWISDAKSFQILDNSRKSKKIFF